jgi:hypothetical protein
MVTHHEPDPPLVAQPATPLEALLSESRELQAISRQLIRESRELRTIYLLLQHNYHVKYQLEKYPDIYASMLLRLASLEGKKELAKWLDLENTRR